MLEQQDDRDRIVQFLVDSKAIFSNLVSQKKDMFPSLLHDHIKSSWEEVERRMDDVINRVKETDQSLKNVGLTGAELNFKLTGFNTAYAKWKNNPWKKILKNLLEWMNVILSSLSHLILIAEPIKEFKDALEAGINSKKIWDKEDE